MTVKLKVAEAFRNDVGRGIVRVDSKVIEELGQNSGEVVEVIGKKSTPAIIWRGISRGWNCLPVRPLRESRIRWC